MATATDALILAALLDHLAALQFQPPLPVAQPGIAFPPAGQDKPDNYLAVSYLPNRPRQVTLGDDPQQKLGLLQVSVYWKAGGGLIKPLDAAGQIIDHFNNKTLFASGVKITISGEPWAAGPIQEDDRVQIPVTIPYTAFEPET
ncbi:phage tail terminator-like protein [Rhizobium sp. SYY.PMSO]|uniref:phage tail terminator-like protein n=1 Tax=Rhizobium sp. SYY.PMSO TaxID=3382192 RepID=UPI000DDA7679